MRPLEESTWDAFAELVERNGGVFGGCWCMGHHQTPEGGSYQQVRGIDKKATKQALVRSGQAHAALVFDEQGLAQGWAKFGRIDELAILAQHGRAYQKQSSARPDWRVACFYTDKNRRREGALDLIREAGGGVVESIPEIHKCSPPTRTETIMATLEGRHDRALLVVDLQQGVVEGAHHRDDVIATVTDLVVRARDAHVPVVWVQHHDDELTRDSPQWQWVQGLGPAEGEPWVEKSFGDAFADTVLEQTLADLGVAEIILVGAASEQCIRCTMHSAVVRGYDVALVKGGHTTVDLTEYGLPEPAVVVAFLDSIASFGMEWPGRRGRSVTPATVDF